MRVAGRPTRTIERNATRDALRIIDQRQLPHRFEWARLGDLEQVERAIREMWLRGAPLIGAAAAYGIALQANVDASDAALERAVARLAQTRPTAVNLGWALARMRGRLQALPLAERARAAWDEADAIAEADVATNAAIGRHGAALLEQAAERNGGGRVDVLTHCNAGWLATVDWGTATAPLYRARERGIDLHVWVDETRPRNQGASLTAWELAHEGVPHTVIADNAGGHLMQRGEVDLVLVGCDRVSARGDVCNKIGTYLKALAAHDNGVPFYVAMPLSTLDLGIADGLAGIPIEERDPREVTHIVGSDAAGTLVEVRLTPAGSAAANPAFDVTPARLVSALVTERGIVAATPDAIAAIAAPPR